MTQLASALSGFQRDLDRATALLDLIVSFRKFAASEDAKRLAAEEDPSWIEGHELANKAPEVRTDLPLLSGSMVLYVCGRFEHFVRNVITVLGDKHLEAAESFSKLPKKVSDEFYKRTLQVATSPNKYSYNQEQSDQMLTALGNSLTRQDTGLEGLDARLLSITETNMNADMLADIFKRVDVKEIWAQLGKQAPLKSYLRQNSDQDTTKSAKSKLDELMRQRNTIAHPTEDTNFPSPEDVEQAITFLKTLSQVTVDVARVPH